MGGCDGGCVGGRVGGCDGGCVGGRVGGCDGGWLGGRVGGCDGGWVGGIDLCWLDGGVGCDLMNGVFVGVFWVDIGRF